MKRLIYGLHHHFDTVAAAVFLSAMMGMTTAQIIGRVTGFQIPWTIEVNRYLLIYLVFFGVSSAARAKAHIGTEFLQNFLGGRTAFYLWLLNQFIFLFFSIVMVYTGVSMVQMHLLTQQVTASLPVNISVAYISVILPIGFGLTAINLIVVILEGIRAEKDRRRAELG